MTPLTRPTGSGGSGGDCIDPKDPAGTARVLASNMTKITPDSCGQTVPLTSVTLRMITPATMYNEGFERGTLLGVYGVRLDDPIELARALITDVDEHFRRHARACHFARIPPNARYVAQLFYGGSKTPHVELAVRPSPAPSPAPSPPPSAPPAPADPVAA